MDEFARLVSDSLGLALSPAQLEMLGVYERTLLEWNQRFNLTAIREAEGIRRKHFLDSLSCALAWRDGPPASLVDVGTGAGFPGLVLKILYPDLRLTLVESISKKAKFCRHLVTVLDLRGVAVLTARAEEAGQMPEHRERYDWAVARAVAAMPVLCEYLLPLVRVGGSILAQKGPSGPEEMSAAAHALEVLGGRPGTSVPVQLPGIDEQRWLMIAVKSAPTPAEYPRRPGMPAKMPL